mmetsp:Transcript_122314/g.351405  ORF Transcript_122314/g.351405 Transcript_122314/m.351405 type:complete len:237 (-) Transcript_122314:343-1053(-)
MTGARLAHASGFVAKLRGSVAQPLARPIQPVASLVPSRSLADLGRPSFLLDSHWADGDLRKHLEHDDQDSDASTRDSDGNSSQADVALGSPPERQTSSRLHRTLIASLKSAEELNFSKAWSPDEPARCGRRGALPPLACRSASQPSLHHEAPTSRPVTRPRALESRMRLEPLPLAPAGERTRSRAADVVIPEDLFESMLQRGKEARRRGQHISDRRPATAGGPRLVLSVVELANTV